jgi:hypothetical protein
VMHDWHSLAYQGDEWLVGYACVPSCAHSVVIFSVGHALELYLKAAHTKLFGDFDKALKFGHSVKSLWDACKKRDSAFLPNHEIRDAIFSLDFLAPQVFETLSRDDQLHYADHQNLYMIAKHLQDLKYLWLPWNTWKGWGTTPNAGFFYFHHDPYWIALFSDLRGYLGHPEHGFADFIGQQMKLGNIPPAAAQYLSGLYMMKAPHKNGMQADSRTSRC